MLSPSALSRPPPACISSNACRARPARSTATAAMDGGRCSAVLSRFPPLAHRDVVLDLASIVDARLGTQLLPSTVPDDVRSFASADGAAIGALDVRRGAPGSAVDFILESWIHCKLPNGALDITSLIAFFNGSTDAPHFILDFVQGSPSSMIVILDLLPRKDLGFHVDYIRQYYEETQLENLRGELAGLPQSRPFVAQALYIRSIQSPTAMVFDISCGSSGETELDRIVRGELWSVAKAALLIWLGWCDGRAPRSGAAGMVERDSVVKRKLIELDLAPNLPRLFGDDVGRRVLAEIQKAYEVPQTSA